MTSTSSPRTSSIRGEKRLPALLAHGASALFTLMYGVTMVIFMMTSFQFTGSIASILLALVILASTGWLAFFGFRSVRSLLLSISADSSSVTTRAFTKKTIPWKRISDIRVIYFDMGVLPFLKVRASAIKLTADDGTQTTITGIFDNFEQIKQFIRAKTDPILMRKMVKALQNGETLEYNILILDKKGIAERTFSGQKRIPWKAITNIDATADKPDQKARTNITYVITGADGTDITVDSRQTPNARVISQIARRFMERNQPA